MSEGAQPAARLHDEISHTDALSGFLTGAALGLAAGLAVVALTVATGGAALVVVAAAGGAVAATGGGALLGEALGETSTTVTGAIATGSPNVFINSRAAARAIADTADCSNHGGSPKQISEGSQTVSINSFPAARETDKIVCGAAISSASPNVIIGGPKGRFLETASEVPGWMHDLATGMVIAGSIVALGAGAAAAAVAGGTCGLIMFGAEVAGSFIGGMAGGVVGGNIGEAIGGERGRIIGEAVGGAIGGFMGGGLGRRTSAGHPVDVASGELFTSATDFQLTGPMAMAWTRIWMSSSRTSPASGGPLGWKWHHPFDMALLRWDDGGGFVARLRDGRLAVFLPPSPEHPSINTVENLLLETDGDRLWLTDYEGVRHHFGRPVGADGVRLLDGMEDANGNRITLERDAAGLLHGVIDSGGRRYAVHQQQGQIVAIDGPDPDRAGTMLRLVSYAYDAAGDLVAARDARGGQTTYAYRNHLLVEERHKAGLTYRFVWDAAERGIAARCVETWGERPSGDGPAMFHAQLRYLPHRRTEVRNGEGAITRYEADIFDRVIHQVDAMGGETRTRYDRAGRITAIVGPGGEQRYTYDTLGRLTARQGADGVATGIDYAMAEPGGMPLGRFRALVEPGGVATAFDHDARGNVTLIRDAAGNEKRVMRDARGRPLALLDTLGTAWRWHWSDAGDLLAEGPQRAARRQYGYDLMGRVREVRRGRDGVFRFVRDANGNVVEVHRPDGGIVRMAYDPDDQPIAHRDALGNQTRWDYDGLRYAVCKTFPDGRTAQYRYNSELKLVAMTNPKGEQYRLDYDPLGRLVHETGFDGRAMTYRYSAEGWLADASDAGRTTRFERDAIGRVVVKHFADGIVHAYAYDDAGRALRADSPDRSLAFAYDALGRMVREEQDGLATIHDFDARGRRVRTTLPDGRVLRIGHGEDGLYDSVQFEQAMLVRLHRDDYGREVEREAGRIRTKQDFDPQGRLIAQSGVDAAGAAVFHRAYRYDQADRIVAIADSLRGEARYRYDACERLIGTAGWSAEAFVPDAADNFLPAEARGSAEGMAPGNRLLRDDRHGFDYDAHGNRTRKYRLDRPDVETRYLYGADNQLREVVELSGEGERWTRFGYDAFGRRTFKEAVWNRHAANDAPDSVAATPVRTSFLWNVDVLLAESDDAADPLATTYVYEPNSFRPLAQVRRTTPDATGSIYRYQLDHLGTPQELVNDNGELVWAAAYRGFGAIARTLVEKVPQPLRFQGQYHDPETGLHYNRARYYAPEERCFVQQDPLRLIGSVNFAMYVRNPLDQVDPFGLTPVDEGGYSVYHIIDTQAEFEDERVRYVGISNDPERRQQEHLDKRLDKEGRYQMQVVERDLTYGQARGYEQADIEKYDTYRSERRGLPIEYGDKNRANSYNRERTDPRAKAFEDGYTERMKMHGGCG
ncbi:RHS repeat-associated core domain-containing protein [Sphingomonas hankookensis]